MKFDFDKIRDIRFSRIRHPSSELMRASDIRLGLIFLGFLVASILVTSALVVLHGMSVYDVMGIMSIPFIVLGIIYFIFNHKYLTGVAVLVATIACWILYPLSAVFVIYLFVCVEGVVLMVEIIQRRTFYEIMHIVECLNTKSKLNYKDRLVKFFFNISSDLDTRDIRIDNSINRNRLPWRDVFLTFWFMLLFCMLLWINVFLDPSFSIATSGVPTYTFTIILYLALIVMPWSILSTLNARVVTQYRDFKLYNGLAGTIKRMIVPVFALLLLTLFVMLETPDQIYYIGMSLAMAAVMCVFTSIIYYTENEMVVVNDILDQWGNTHPTHVYSGYNPQRQGYDEVPGTPKRDPMDCFKDIRSRNR